MLECETIVLQSSTLSLFPGFSELCIHGAQGPWWDWTSLTMGASPAHLLLGWPGTTPSPDGSLWWDRIGPKMSLVSALWETRSPRATVDGATVPLLTPGAQDPLQTGEGMSNPNLPLQWGGCNGNFLVCVCGYRHACACVRDTPLTGWPHPLSNRFLPFCHGPYPIRHQY